MLTADDGQFIDIDGLRTFYIRRGKGHPIVLIHGGAPGVCTSVSWSPNVDRFVEAGFEVIAFDQPGFGLTENGDDFSMEFRCRHAKAFLTEIAPERFHMIANSQGAYIAVKIALEDSRARRFVTTASGTISPPGSAASEEQAAAHGAQLRGYEPSLENVRTMTMKTLYHDELVDDALVATRYEMSAGKNFEAQQKRRDAPPPASLSDVLPTLENKTLLLWGRNDHGVSLERGMLLFQQLPNVEMHVFSECGHWCQWDRTERFHNVVENFLDAPDD